MLSKNNKINEFIIHRINTISQLKNIDKKYGVEIDIRSFKSKLILNHEPYVKGDFLDDYLENYKNKTLILNIKESGIEDDVLKSIKKFNIKSFFLLDIEFPYIFKLIKKKNKNFAIRYSEYEIIAMLNDYKDKAKWAWIDTPNILPINKTNKVYFKKFKTCLVCPERWGRKNDIKKYKKYFEKIKFYPTSVMTSIDCVSIWNN